MSHRELLSAPALRYIIPKIKGKKSLPPSRGKVRAYPELVEGMEVKKSPPPVSCY